MDRAAAIKFIKHRIKSQYGTQSRAAEAIGLSPVQMSRVFNDDWRPISPELLRMAGLVAVVSPTTYRREG